MRFLNCHIGYFPFSLLIPKRALFKNPEGADTPEESPKSGLSDIDNASVGVFIADLENQLNQFQDIAENFQKKLNIVDQARMAVESGNALKDVSDKARFEALRKIGSLLALYRNKVESISNGVSLYVKMSALGKESGRNIGDVRKRLTEEVFGVHDFSSGIVVGNAWQSYEAARKLHAKIGQSLALIEGATYSFMLGKTGKLSPAAKKTMWKLTLLHHSLKKGQDKNSQLVRAGENFIRGNAILAKNEEVLRNALHPDGNKNAERDPWELDKAADQAKMAQRMVRSAETTYTVITGDTRRFGLSKNTIYTFEPFVFGPKEDEAKRKYKEMPTVSIAQASAVEKMKPGEKMNLSLPINGTPYEVTIMKQPEDKGSGWELVLADNPNSPSTSPRVFDTSEAVLFEATLLAAQQHEFKQKERSPIVTSIKETTVKPTSMIS